MKLCSRRTIALLLFLAALVHPAVHGESVSSLDRPLLRDAGASSTDCPCVRAAVITASAPTDPGRPLGWTALEGAVELTTSRFAVRSASSRAPPQAQSPLTRFD